MRNNVFTEEFNKSAVTANYGKRIQPISSLEKYAYETREDLVCEKEEIKCSKIIKYIQK